MPIFWINCKLHFSNKHGQADNDIVLNKYGELNSKNEEIVDIFHYYFSSVVKNLNLELRNE